MAAAPTAGDPPEVHGERYVDRFEQRHASSARLSRLVPLLRLRPDSMVADLGCGGGLLLPLVAGRVRRYVGVDTSPQFIERAQRRREALGAANAEFFRCTIPELCARFPGAIDVALALDIAEHIPDGEWRTILAAVRGALAPGGRLVIHTPDGDFLPEVMKRHGIILRQLPEHVAVRDTARHEALLREAGFTRLRIAHLPHYNILRAVHPLSRLPVVGRRFRARLLIEAER